MSTAIRVLHLEDNSRDAELVRQRLAADGVLCDIVNIRSRQAFESALATDSYDLLLLDYQVPGYDGREALAYAREKCPLLPAVIVSGILGEEESVECLKAGAEDYVLKHRMQRLGSAVQRALKNAADRRLRSDAEQALRESEHQLNLALEASELAVWQWDIPSGVVSFSSHWWPILGYGPGEVALRIEAWEKLTCDTDRERVRAAIAAHFKGLAPVIHVEYRMRAKDGGLRWMRSVGRVVERDPAGRALRAIGTHGDITSRRQGEEKIANLTRIDRLRARVNSLIVRARDRQEVLEEACQIAVSAAGYVMAWIGFVDSATGAVIPAAKAGRDDGYLGIIQPSTDVAAPGGLGIVGECIREKRPAVRGDFETDRRAINRELALTLGYRSAIALPLTVDDAVCGAFSIYAAEPRAFDEEEVRLLDELAADISFALDYIAKRERLDYLAYYDPLTGLANRTLFIDRCDRLLHGPGVHTMVAVMLLDLARFRHVNETVGRHAGDQLLQRVAEALRRALADPATVARAGADCFAIAIPQLASGADAARYFRDVIGPAVGTPLEFQGAEYRLAAKAGIALGPKDGGNAATLLKNAESALNCAKASGEAYSFYEPDVHARVATRLTLESELRRALEHESFVLHYQPKFNTRTGAITGLEALMRWPHPERGLVAPDKFIPVLEETGLIREVGAWALREIAADFRRWVRGGMAAPRVAVNVSAVQLRQPDFPSQLGQVLKSMRETHPDLSGLDIEITESVIMHDVESQIPLLARIRDMGIRVVIDDFGTGFSSLQYIARLPIDAVKIDCTFVRGLTSRPADRAVVSTIISLAHSLGLLVVAEGVEYAEQYRILDELGCDEVQGYLWSRPVPARDVPALSAAMKRS